MARKSLLLPIADREALTWIVREQRTAFGEHRAREAEKLEPEDVLLLYTTRGCFRNPTRDRGRVIGRATVTAPVRRLAKPVVFGDREFPYIVEFRIESLAPRRKGVELAPLVTRLRETFPDPATWSVRMRRALVPLPPADARLLEGELRRAVPPYPEALSTYSSG
jgi:hypothetical protein